jgi:HSF-type DNA-binding
VQDSHGGASAASTLQAAGDTAGQQVPAYLMPDRKPKNFADRLMRVLLNDAAPDILWWVGDGKAVAFHPKNLKKGTLLQTHFKTKDYNAFIRNCNRW